jgi:aspartyl-tRNA(Asn)/glutamyl-tRNA(Gln) amidotransferase subunit A
MMSAQEQVEKSIAAIASWESSISAFCEVLKDDAKKQASELDVNLEIQKLPFAGVPIAVKENIATKLGHTNASSKILKNYTSPFNATAIQKMISAGAIIIGKTQQDEFGMGSSTENSGLPPQTKNPWDISKVAGGSSGGSAAAVASGEVTVAFGTDTGGSIRQPASFCGVVGLKPTYGRVSRHGLLAYGSSLDTAGSLTRTVRDAAKVLEITAGHDALDATSSQVPVGKYVDACEKGLIGIRVGVPKEFFAEGIDSEVSSIIKSAIDNLKILGAEIIEISLPLTPAAIAVYYLIAKSEASSNLARFDGLRYETQEDSKVSLLDYYKQVRGRGFGPEVKRAILMGTYALSSGYVDEWYGKASKVRTLIRQEYEQAFQSVDVIVGPVAPEPAFELGSKTANPLAMYLGDAYTVPVSVAGLPAMSVPCGMTSKNLPGRQAGLPVGLQIIAPHFGEEVMFQVGAAYEDANTWKDLMPELA